MNEIGLADTIEALRRELGRAAAAMDEDVQFPVGPVTLEFQVGVTKDAEGRAGVRFWVIELGAGGSYTTESVQKVTITLEAPRNRYGETVTVYQELDRKP